MSRQGLSAACDELLHSLCGWCTCVCHLDDDQISIEEHGRWP